MINLICIGKLKKELVDSENEYLKRISKFSKINVIEIKEASGNSKEEILKKEEKLMLPKLKDNICILSEEGKNMNSMEFSNIIKNDITFVIGSSYGLSENVKNKGKLISLSKMTFSHQLARIILLEQIYRAYCIQKNLPYQRD